MIKKGFDNSNVINHDTFISGCGLTYRGVYNA